MTAIAYALAVRQPIFVVVVVRRVDRADDQVVPIHQWRPFDFAERQRPMRNRRGRAGATRELRRRRGHGSAVVHARRLRRARVVRGARARERERCADQGADARAARQRAAETIPHYFFLLADERIVASMPSPVQWVDPLRHNTRCGTAAHGTGRGRTPARAARLRARECQRPRRGRLVQRDSKLSAPASMRSGSVRLRLNAM